MSGVIGEVFHAVQRQSCNIQKEVILVSEYLVEAVPVPPSRDLAGPVPVIPVLETMMATPAASTPRPLVEPFDSFEARLKEIEPAPAREMLRDFTVLPRRVSHRNFQTPFNVSQGSRGACWAFAGIAALEAAYARIGVAADLSEQYLFHISKAYGNHTSGGGINSLIGFMGSADIVHHLKYWSVPTFQNVPFIDQPALQQLANAIPNTGGALANASSGTREQNDWFEFDLRNIPLLGRWFAQYRVQDYGQISSYTNDDIRRTLAAGRDVVVDVNDKINNGGHVLLIHGYDDDAQTFDIKNSQSLPGFTTMKYANDPQFDIQYQYSMYYITAVAPVETQWAAMWIGRWETDHDGWRGSLVMRRFLDITRNETLPGPASRISLGTWYGEDGRMLDVVGHFVDQGRGLFCNIGDQPFELYLHTRDPYRAGGRCYWNNQHFGVVLSRGNAVGAGAGFNRTETIGLWDTVHDGWRGQFRIGVEPVYVQAADAASRHAWIDGGAVANRVDAHVDFGGDNRNQPFELLAHTREDGILGGLTSWGGRDWPVEGRMSQNLYAIRDNGELRWYRHTGRYRLSEEWDAPKVVGNGWGAFLSVFGGGDGVVYAIRHDGVLLWYYHDGRNQGTFDWQGAKEVGIGWSGFARVFAGDGGVIYAITTQGKLLWYRHQGRRDGTFRWQGPFEVGSQWNSFTSLAAAPDGCIYGVQPNGTLLWYRHYGFDQGYPIWHGPVAVGIGWQPYDRIWAVGNGFIYGRTAANGGDLWMWRHHGFLTGEGSWTPAIKVGNGWGGGIKEVFAT
ncbi:secreted protein [Paraburkholderia caribensis MBA4]|uniref:Secreted protein n=1 Tax=Paraburkholderia caribensis MBA4 TaxID=1323664 RepID=A0A0P0REK4_9BURK|nr:tachylectin-related carbohydrate-binding protein [Paraburkholderia caribensis]ALL66854.1 secreted protein [Paraburkholderia caribensis MBA4]